MASQKLGKKEQKIRISMKKAARRSRKITKREGKVKEQNLSKPKKISQKRMATINKSRYCVSKKIQDSKG